MTDEQFLNYQEYYKKRLEDIKEYKEDIKRTKIAIIQLGIETVFGTAVLAVSKII